MCGLCHSQSSRKLSNTTYTCIQPQILREVGYATAYVMMFLVNMSCPDNPTIPQPHPFILWDTNQSAQQNVVRLSFSGHPLLYRFSLSILVALMMTQIHASSTRTVVESPLARSRARWTPCLRALGVGGGSKRRGGQGGRSLDAGKEDGHADRAVRAVEKRTSRRDLCLTCGTVFSFCFLSVS